MIVSATCVAICAPRVRDEMLGELRYRSRPRSWPAG